MVSPSVETQGLCSRRSQRWPSLGLSFARSRCSMVPCRRRAPSAPYTPRSNGACEAGNGTIKHLAHQIACGHDRPAAWSPDDLDAARLLANRRIIDRCHDRTPEQRFADRTPVTVAERDRFDAAHGAARRRRLAQPAVESKTPQRSIAALRLNAKPSPMPCRAPASSPSGAGEFVQRTHFRQWDELWGGTEESVGS